MSKKTFEEWISGFEDRYTSEQIEMFKDVWDVSVRMRDVSEKHYTKDTSWHINWIHEVATEIGK